ncbi:MAG: hypothetical protein ACYSYU_11250, partial [Planctomycetota bacterium]
LDDEYNSYWIASDGRSVPLGSRPGYKKEHHFEYAERIIHGTKDQIGNFVTPSEFGQKTGAIRAHISPSAMILEAFGPVSRKQAELIRKYATEHKTDIKWEVVSPFKTSFGEAREFSWDTYSQYGIDLNAPNLLRDERGFLNIVPSKSKGPFTFENIQRARELARKQGGTKFEKAVLGWSEFWKPWSTLPDSQLQLAVRYKFMGDLGRSGKFIDKQFEILKKYPQATRKDLFHFMDGQLPADALPPELLGVATRLRKISNWVGQMAVKRGLINKDTFLEMKDSYIHYMYLKHFFPEGEAPVGGQRMDRGTFKRRKGLTYEQQQAIELMEDVAVAFPTGIGKTLADVFRYDYFKTLAENPQITWQPARVAVDEIPVMRKGEPTGKTKPELKSIGEIDKEIKMYERMAAMKEGGLNPVAQERYNKLKVAEAQAKEISGNAPEGFRQMPISENYGPLSGAFVRKPVYNDIMPLVRGLMSDPESGWAQAIKGFETATTVFKVAKVPLNPPTVIRNIVSNLLQMNMSGIPFWDVPFVWERGIRSFIAKDKFYRQLERMGGYHTNFTVAELGEIHEVFRDIISKGKKGYWPIRAAGKLAKYYGRIDDIAKLSLYRHAVTKKGMSPGLAAVHAQKWGMDYSMASRSVKGARRTVLPFVTYQYKIAPLIVEAMLKRPWVIAKFAIAPYVLTRIAAKKFNWTKDDV